ncbi:MAG TPA: hypothetical protein VGI64_12460 [Streptosporangiaceae bacterium]|jgi:hypothetical protein
MIFGVLGKRAGPRLAAAVAVAAATAIGLMAGSGSAQAATTPGWRLVKTIGPADGESFLIGVSASGPTSGWAVGQLCTAACRGGTSKPADLIEHWTGQKWVRRPAPAGFSDIGDPTAISGGVFVTAMRSGRTHVLRWNGRRWLDSGTPGCSFVRLAAFGARNVWAFSNALCAARFNGRSWRKIRMPGAASGGFTALSPSDIWAVGVSAATVSKPPAKAVHLAMHWNGRSWHAMRVPTVPHPAGSVEGAGLVAATSSHDVWVNYGWSRSGCCTALRAMEHWNGKRWLRLMIPFATDTFGDSISDGHGGFWLEASLGPRSATELRMYHFNAGRWRRMIVRAPAGMSVSLSFASIPRSRSAWGVGGVSPLNNPQSFLQAAIYKFGQ